MAIKIYSGIIKKLRTTTTQYRTYGVPLGKFGLICDRNVVRGDVSAEWGSSPGSSEFRSSEFRGSSEFRVRDFS